MATNSRSQLEESWESSDFAHSVGSLPGNASFSSGKETTIIDTTGHADFVSLEKIDASIGSRKKKMDHLEASVPGQGSESRRSHGNYDDSHRSFGNHDEEDARWTDEELRQYIISLKLLSLPSEFQILIFLEDALSAGIDKHPWVGRRDDTGKLLFHNGTTMEVSRKHPHELALQQLAESCRYCLTLDSSARATYIQLQRDTWTAEAKAHAEGWVPKMSRTKKKPYFHRRDSAETVWENPAEVVTMMNNFRVTVLGWLLDNAYSGFLRGGGSSFVKNVDAAFVYLTIDNVNADALMADEAMFSGLKNKVKQTIAKEAGNGLRARNVSLSLLHGSLEVEAKVTCAVSAMNAVHSSLNASKTLSRELLESVKRVRGIKQVSVASIAVRNVTIATLQQRGKKKSLSFLDHEKLEVQKREEAAIVSSANEELRLSNEGTRKAKDELAQALREVKRLTADITRLGHEKETQAAILSSTNEELRKSTEETRKARDELAKAWRETENLTTDITRLRHEKETQAAILSSTNEELRKSTEETRKVKDELAEGLRKVENLTTDIARLGSEKETQASISLSTKEELRWSTEETRKAKDELAQALAEVQILTADIERLRPEKETQAAMLSSTKEELKSSSEESRKVKDELAQALREVQNLTEVIARLEHEKEMQAAMLSSTKVKNAQSIEETFQTKDELAKARLELENLTTDIARLGHEKETQAAILSSTKEELRKSTEETRKAKDELAQALRDVESLTTDIAQLGHEKETQALKSIEETTKAKDELAQALQDMASLTTDVARLGHEKETQAAILLSTKEDLRSSIEETAKAKDELAQALREVQSLTADLARWGPTQEAQAAILSSTRDELRESADETKKAQDELAQALQEVQSLTTVIARLELEKETQAQTAASTQSALEVVEAQQEKLLEDVQSTMESGKVLQTHTVDETMTPSMEYVQMHVESAVAALNVQLQAHVQNSIAGLHEQWQKMQKEDHEVQNTSLDARTPTVEAGERVVEVPHARKVTQAEAENAMLRLTVERLEKERIQALEAFEGLQAAKEELSNELQSEKENRSLQLQEYNINTAVYQAERDILKRSLEDVEASKECLLKQLEEKAADDFQNTIVRIKEADEVAAAKKAAEEKTIKETMEKLAAEAAEEKAKREAEQKAAVEAAEKAAREKEKAAADAAQKAAQEKAKMEDEEKVAAEAAKKAQAKARIAKEDHKREEERLAKRQEERLATMIEKEKEDRATIQRLQAALVAKEKESVHHDMAAAIVISNEEASARERLRHYYEEAGLELAEYEAFQRSLDRTVSREAREQMLDRKTKQVEGYLESISGILEPLQELKALVFAATDFEASTNAGLKRFSGNSAHSADEEKFRWMFASELPVLVHAVLENIAIFEEREKQKFMHYGVELRPVLRAIEGQELAVMGMLDGESCLGELSALLHIVKDTADTPNWSSDDTRYLFRTSKRSAHAGSAQASPFSAFRFSSPKYLKDWRRYIQRSSSAPALNSLNGGGPQNMHIRSMQRTSSSPIHSRLRNSLSNALQSDKQYSTYSANPSRQNARSVPPVRWR